MSETAPEYMSIAKAMEQKDIIEKSGNAVEHLRNAAAAGKVTGTPEVDPEVRTFLSPVYPEAEFLARPGKAVIAPFQSAVLGLPPVIMRDGDVWVKFNSGICLTKDPDQIEFLEAHSGFRELHGEYHRKHGTDPAACDVPFGLCRENGPGMDVWAELKYSQVPTMTRNATLSAEIDVDALVRGEYAGKKHTLTRGTGAEMERTAEANAAAVAQRGDGRGE